MTKKEDTKGGTKNAYWNMSSSMTKNYLFNCSVELLHFPPNVTSQQHNET
jgi:hypothetical protein